MDPNDAFRERLLRGRKDAIDNLRRQEFQMVRSAYREAFERKRWGWHVILGKHLYDALERIADPTSGLGTATGVEFSLLSLPELGKNGDVGTAEPPLRVSRNIDDLIQMLVTSNGIHQLSETPASEQPEMNEFVVNGSLEHAYHDLSRALNLAALHYLRDWQSGPGVPDAGLQSFSLRMPLKGGPVITDTLLDTVPIPLPSKETYLGLAASGKFGNRLGCYVFGVAKQHSAHVPQISIVYADLFQRAVRSYEKTYSFVERHAPATPTARRPSPGRT